MTTGKWFSWSNAATEPCKSGPSRLPNCVCRRSSIWTDPYEFADITSNTYWDWVFHNAWMIYGVLAGVQKFMDTFKEFPPAQHPDSFTPEQAHETLSKVAGAS